MRGDKFDPSSLKTSEKRWERTKVNWSAFGYNCVPITIGNFVARTQAGTIRQVIAEISASRDAVLYVANQLTNIQELEADDKKDSQD